MKYKLNEIYDGHYFADLPDLHCVLEGDKETKLGLYIEILNMDDATGEPEYKDYPYLVSFSLMAAKPHKSFNEDEATEKPSRLSLISDCNAYMGGVPIDHTLTLAVNGGFDECAKQFTADEAKVVKQQSSFGTYAAQNGPGAELQYLQFATETAAKRFVDWILDNRISVLTLMVGFILDRPINMAGEDGWSVIRGHVYGAKSQKRYG